MKRITFKKKVAILGAGSWGTSLAVTIASRHDIMMWEFDPEQAKLIEKERRNKKFLPMVSLPDNIHITNSIEEAIKDAHVIIFAVPSHVLRNVAVKASDFITHRQYLVSVVKGVEHDTLFRMTEVIADCIEKYKGIITLDGPTHAEEVALKVPTAIVAASKKLWHAKTIQRLFMTPNFRIYTNSDIIGVEIGAALKNVIAIAAGICDGLNYGDNTKAALITRGLAEIKRLGVKMGAKEKTFSGLSGMGDMIATCMSKYSRNRKVGMMLGHGRKLDDILNEMTQIAEGVKNTKSAIALSKKYHVELPIANAIASILFKNNNVKNIENLLMTRTPKNEFY